MSSENSEKGSQDKMSNLGRRKFLETTALAGAATAGFGLLAGCAPGGGQGTGGKADAGTGAATSASAVATDVPPGKLDDYYIISSGGHSGEVRIYGCPSGRTIKRIPVFNIDPMVGWGITNESRAIMGTKPNGELKYWTGDTHHVHGSYEDGIYDGKFFWINDKLHARVARIRGDTFEVDKITEIPNIQGQHGLFTDKRDPVKSDVNHTTRVFAGAEFHLPLPNDGRDMDAPGKYGCLFSCLDADTMDVRWQCRIDGNMDLVATTYDGKYAASNQYNTEGGVHYEEMMAAEFDACVFFDIARIEAAIAAGKTTTIGDSKVPVVDGRKAANADPKTALTCYVPVPKNPHGVNASPDGKYFVCSGKLSPTCSVIDLSLVEKWFAGQLEKPRDAVVAEPNVGLGPLHTGFDGRGNAYTTLFLDSKIVKWNVDKAIAQFKGDKSVKDADVVLDAIDVHYQPGHGYTSMGETRTPDGKYFNSGNKFSKDRFLPVGPLHVETEQLIDISGDKMVLLHDHTAYPEPHDAIIVRADVIKTRQIYNIDEFPNATKDAKDARIERDGNRVHVHLTSQAPSYAIREFNVKKGDIVTITLTNLDKVEDLTHGFGIPKYNINFIVNPQETKSVTFVADKPGVYWCYCTHFCHALHLEMRLRMMVSA